MSCFVTLHFLLLCLAEEYPGLRKHAAATIKEFLDLVEKEPTKNLKTCVPDLGRFLVRFLLTESEIPLRENVAIIVRELFNRNVRWVDPSKWPEASASEEEKEMQIEASFDASAAEKNQALPRLDFWSANSIQSVWHEAHCVPKLLHIEISRIGP